MAQDCLFAWLKGYGGETARHAAARISASKELIERGFGKSSNIVSLKLETPLSELSPKDALATITDKVMSGELPVGDGTKLTGVIEARMKAVEVAELESRLIALEKKCHTPNCSST